MLNFAPTEEQEEIRNLAYSVASEQLRPRARDAEKRGDIAPELMKTLAQTGLTTPFPKTSGNGVVRPVCASVFISSGAISPLFSASRARGRNCSLATLYARLRISSCSSVGAKLSMDSFLSLTFFPRTEARDHVPPEVIRRQPYLLVL